MSLYCVPCRQMLRDGEGHCPRCFGTARLACTECNQGVPDGSVVCPNCARAALAVVVAPPSKSVIPAAVVTAKPVLERYEAGQYGVKALVQMAGEDAAILNELLQLVGYLHAMAARSNQFRGHTDNTRKMIRQMRDLATLVQEEVELRRGPA